MANVLQVKSIRVFYDTPVKTKLTAKFNGVITSGNEPDIVLDVNGGSKTVTTTAGGIQIVDGGSNSLITYATSVEIKETDYIVASNTDGAKLPVFYGVAVDNRVVANPNTSYQYDSDDWDYYITLGKDGGSPEEYGYIANVIGGLNLNDGKAGRNSIPLTYFTVEDGTGSMRLECGKDGTSQLFGKSCTVSIQGVPRAVVPLKLGWNETLKQYEMIDIQIGYLGDEFKTMVGGKVGISISAHH